MTAYLYLFRIYSGQNCYVKIKITTSGWRGPQQSVNTTRIIGTGISLYCVYSEYLALSNCSTVVSWIWLTPFSDCVAWERRRTRRVHSTHKTVCFFLAFGDSYTSLQFLLNLFKSIHWYIISFKQRLLQASKNVGYTSGRFEKKSKI